MEARCENCGSHFLVDPRGDIQGGGCPDCGHPRPFRMQPSPVQSEGTLRDMVDSDSQVDQGGNPLGEGTIVGDDGEVPLNTGNRGRDNYMHSSIPAILAERWQNPTPLGNGRPMGLEDTFHQPEWNVPLLDDDNQAWSMECPTCDGEGRTPNGDRCPQCHGEGLVYTPQQAAGGEGYEEPYDVHQTQGIVPGAYQPEGTLRPQKRNFGAAPQQMAGPPCPECGEELHADPQTSSLYCLNGHEHPLGRDEELMGQGGWHMNPEDAHAGDYEGTVDLRGMKNDLGPIRQGKTADAMQDILGIPVEPQQHNNFLRWEPGMRGRGLVVAGEPHTWNAYDPTKITGNESAEALGLTHRPYVESLGIHPDSIDWRTGIEIEPNGEVQSVGGHDPAPFIQADPRLKPMTNNPLDNFFSAVKHSPYSRHAPMDPYLPWTHEADAVEFDKGPLAGPLHAAIITPGPAGIHGAHYKYLHGLDAHLDGQPVRQMGIGGIMMTYADPNRKQPVEVRVHHPEHLQPLQEQLEMGQSEPVPAMNELRQRIQNGEVPPPPQEQQQQAVASTKEALDAPEMAGWAGGGMAGGAAGEAIGTALMPGVGTVAGGLIGKVAGGLMGKAFGGLFGGGGNPNASMPEEQPNLALAAVLMADYETPASNPDVGIKNDNDPEKVDQKEFNDQDHSPENLLNPNLEDSGASGEDGVREHAGFGPESPGVERLKMNLPLVMHYYHSPESAENDPLMRHLHETLDAENPGYLDRVTPEDEQMADEWVKNYMAQKPQEIHAKTAIVNVDPNDINQHLENMVSPSGNPQVQPGAIPQQGNCPQCGGVLNGGGACPQCGAGAMAAGNQQTPMPTPGALAQGFASFDPVMALLAANHQGPTTPEQIAAVQELLIQQGRDQETPNVPIEPWNYVKEMAMIQQQPNVAPQVEPQEQAHPPQPQMAPPGGMPMPGMAPGEAGGQPMQPMARSAADSVASKCPRCNSHTTGMLMDEDNNQFCHSCGNIWKAEKAKKDPSVNKETRVAAPHDNPVAVPADEQHFPPNPEGEEDSSLTWHDKNGQKLVPGQEYEMINPKFELPDVIRVEHVKPDGIEVTLIGMIENEPNTLQARKTITKQELETDHMEFVPVAESMEDRGNQPPPGNAAPGEPPRPQTTDELETPHAMAPTSSVDHCPRCGWKEYTSSMASAESYFNECFKCGHTWEQVEQGYETDHLAHTRDWIKEDSAQDNSFWEGYERAQGIEAAKQSSRNLGDIAAKDHTYQAIKERLNANSGVVEKLAGRHFTPSEQRELIDEEGTARNADLLDLEGTHYAHPHKEDYSGKANGMNVPDDHLIGFGF